MGYIVTPPSHIHTHIHIHKYAYIHVYVYISICMCVIYLYIHKHTYMYIHICIHIHMCLNIYMYMWRERLHLTLLLRNACYKAMVLILRFMLVLPWELWGNLMTKLHPNKSGCLLHHGFLISLDAFIVQPSLKTIIMENQEGCKRMVMISVERYRELKHLQESSL